jgi:putative component of membrane protein insertase Oxa1/YidC/SpoIIIJ protein YidD
MIEAIKKYGVIGGTLRGIRRICRCHPFYRGDLNDPP